MFNLLGSMFNTFNSQAQQASNEQSIRNQQLSIGVNPWEKFGFRFKTVDELCRDVIEGQDRYPRSNQWKS